MPNSRRRGKERKDTAVSEEKYSDVDEQDMLNDDINEFYNQQEKVMLEKGQLLVRNMDSELQEEIFGLDESDDDLIDDRDIKKYKKQLRQLRLHQKKTEIGSDIEDETEEPEQLKFGRKRSHFYMSKQDVDDEDIELSGSSEEDAAAILEEKESRALQQKMAEDLEMKDFGLEIFQTEKTAEIATNEEKISQNLSKIPRSEQLQLLQKKSPELLPLIEDYKEKLEEIKSTCLPLISIEKSKLPVELAEYISLKTCTTLNYCTNISFYLVLKSRGVQVHNHPVIKRLVQYRNLLKEFEPLDEHMKEKVKNLLECVKQEKPVRLPTTEKGMEFVRRSNSKSSKKSKAKKQKLCLPSKDSPSELDNKEKWQFETGDEKAALAYYSMMKNIGPRKSDSEESDTQYARKIDEDNAEMEEHDLEENQDEDGKRGISYQIEKNKGMMPKRKREQRNPRVKHRKKYRKAQIRRRGQVRESRTELSRYGGEISGIRAGIKRGVKMRA